MSRWTSKDRYELFTDIDQDEPPHWLVQVGIIILLAAALIAACYL